MRKVLSAAQMREADRLTGERCKLPTLLLMETAARAALNTIAARFNDNIAHKHVLILCGRGNNGGDGAAIARQLWLARARADVVLFGRLAEDAPAGDARVNLEIVQHLVASDKSKSSASLTFTECTDEASWREIARALNSYDVIVDALFGTGLTRPLEGLPLQAVEHLNALRAARDETIAGTNNSINRPPFIVSIDIPSGLNADSAEIIGANVCADLTVTFTAPKLANVMPPAAHDNGTLVIAPIGTPSSLIESFDAKTFFVEETDARAWLMKTRYAPDSYKNTHGHALIFAGSRNLTGAAVLASGAAMRAGAGLVTLATSISAQTAIIARLMPEIMTAALAETENGAISDESFDQARDLIERASAVAIGPGLTSKDEATRRFVYRVVKERRTPVAIDADGLNALAPFPNDLRGSKEHPLILTPHLGEMKRLLGMDNSATFHDCVKSAREFAVQHELILVLKGSRTIVAAPDARVFINSTGNAGLGTAGAGDTLTGIIASFNAQAFSTLKDETDAIEATVAAVYIGGLAGDIAAQELGMRTMTASDIREHLSQAIRRLDAQGERP
jgi:NAD(P)H-hydrate epimerase